MKKGYVLFLTALIFFISAAFHQARAQVKINEFLAHNVWTNADMVDYDDFSDWVELYNSGSSEVDIGGYYLTGNLKNPKKSQIPSGTTIPANGYLLFWCDGHNAKPGTRITKSSQSSIMATGYYSTTTKYYHAGFKLDKEGEQLGLFDASGKVVDSITYGQQLMDVSMGRNPADGKWCYFDQPTPGEANSTTAKPLTAQRSGAVTFSPDAGFSTSDQSVTLKSSDNSPIYYATDGSIPNAGSTKYSSPISVSANAVIRARTITNDKIAGLVATNTYFKESPRKLMVIEMTTDQTFLDDQTIGIFKRYRKYRKVPVIFECFETNGKPAVRFNGAIQVGSLTNYNCPQHPLQITLAPKYGDEFVHYRFFAKPIAKFNKLRLRQGGDAWNSNLIADDLLDPICYGQMACGIQAYRGVVTYINGKYNGIMDLREQFRNEYFKQNYGCDTTGMQEVRRMLAANGMSETWETVHGSKSSWDQVVSGSTNYENTKAKVDINSMIDFYVMEGFACNVSWGHNEDMWWVPNAKWRWLTTDIDRCFEYQGTYSNISTDVIHNKAAGISGSFIQQSEIFGSLMENTEFKNHFCQRFMAHLNSTLKASRLTRIVDSVVAMLTPEMAANTSKWGSQGGVRNVSTWNSEINTMKKFCNERGDKVITHLEKDMTGGTASPL